MIAVNQCGLSHCIFDEVSKRKRSRIHPSQQLMPLLPQGTSRLPIREAEQTGVTHMATPTLPGVPLGADASVNGS